MNANRNSINGLRTKAERVAAALEELEAAEAVIQPLIEEPLDPRIPGWFPDSAKQTIWTTRRKLETEITRLDLKLEKAIAANGANRAANRANGPVNGPTVYPELTDAELSVLEMEIEYLMRDVEVLQRDDCPAFTQVEFKNAVEAGNANVVHLLLRAPTIDPSADNNWAIIHASEKGHTNVIKLLLADPRVDPSADNNAAICWASDNGHTDVVKVLLADARVDPSANDNDAIRWASYFGLNDVVKLLLADHRVDPSAYDNTAIRWASLYGYLDVVQLLLERREVVAKGMSREHIDAAKTEEIRVRLRATFNVVGGRRRTTRRTTRKH